MKPFAERVAFFRHKHALTQRELAEGVGVTSNTVARWERGELAPSSMAVRFFDLLEFMETRVSMRRWIAASLGHD